jgi:hypothetical protein
MERGHELGRVRLTENGLASSERLVGDKNETSLAPMARLGF